MMRNQKNRPASYKRMSYMQKIASINARRRMGDVTIVAQRTGFGTSTVSEVLSGMYMNKRIINKAYDMSRGRKVNQRVIQSMGN
jgi:predicted site-specific integrase-resolvase